MELIDIKNIGSKFPKAWEEFSGTVKKSSDFVNTMVLYDFFDKHGIHLDTIMFPREFNSRYTGEHYGYKILLKGSGEIIQSGACISLKIAIEDGARKCFLILENRLNPVFRILNAIYSILYWTVVVDDIELIDYYYEESYRYYDYKDYKIMVKKEIERLGGKFIQMDKQTLDFWCEINNEKHLVKKNGKNKRI